MKKLIGLMAILAMLLACSEDATEPESESSPNETSAPSTANEAPPETGVEEEAEDEISPCQEAGRQAAEGEDFDLEACSTLTSFRAAYNQASDETATRGELLELLEPLCEGETGDLCNNVDAVLRPTTTTTTTTLPPPPPPTTVDPLAGEGEDQFVALAQQLGAGMGREDLLALGNAACEFARMGPEIFDSYVAASVEPVLVAPGALNTYSLVLGAAGIKLCPDAISVIQPVVERLAGR